MAVLTAAGSVLVVVWRGGQIAQQVETLTETVSRLAEEMDSRFGAVTADMQSRFEGASREVRELRGYLLARGRRGQDDEG